ncbi:uncharacterized protein LOC126796991 [Argentina anserina]|uniref:uncharacterized protein LOC126796991 n=1 Tax=Argentina anserina TaxID=57926 RepID=UPI00217649B7|nr:uncharacterized protein LOC126796991 [Potentilla anserina]
MEVCIATVEVQIEPPNRGRKPPCPLPPGPLHSNALPLSYSLQKHGWTPNPEPSKTPFLVPPQALTLLKPLSHCKNGKLGAPPPLSSPWSPIFFSGFEGLEKDIDAQMSFGGHGGKLQGDFKVQEDRKHRKTYKALSDSEQKLQFFSARQIACRVLGSRGYLCQKCWLPLEDCMCSRLVHYPLWPRMRFWLYMHPNDFLRQNNTGKLLWQVFVTEAATLCLFGITEQEEIMWDAFKLAARCYKKLVLWKNNVCCLYPNKNGMVTSVQHVFGQESAADLEGPYTKVRLRVLARKEWLVFVVGVGEAGGKVWCFGGRF